MLRAGDIAAVGRYLYILCCVDYAKAQMICGYARKKDLETVDEATAQRLYKFLRRNGFDTELRDDMGGIEDDSITTYVWECLCDSGFEDVGRSKAKETWEYLCKNGFGKILGDSTFLGPLGECFAYLYAADKDMGEAFWQCLNADHLTQTIQQPVDVVDAARFVIEVSGVSIDHIQRVRSQLHTPTGRREPRWTGEGSERPAYLIPLYESDAFGHHAFTGFISLEQLEDEIDRMRGTQDVKTAVRLMHKVRDDVVRHNIWRLLILDLARGETRRSSMTFGLKRNERLREFMHSVYPPLEEELFRDVEPLKPGVTG